MSVKVNIASYLIPYSDNREIIEVNGGTVGECLADLVRQYPGMSKALYDEEGLLHDYVALYVNGEDAYPDTLAHKVRDGDEIHVLYIIGGG